MNEPSILIGLDAGEPTLIERWVKEGHLSTLASLMKKGVWHRLLSGGARMVKKLRQLRENNTSAAHPTFPESQLVEKPNRLDSPVASIIHCLCPDDYVRDGNEPDTRSGLSGERLLQRV